MFPGERSGFRTLPPDVIDLQSLEAGKNTVFEFTPPDDDRRYLAVARPVEENGIRFGAFVVAKPRADIQDRWITLVQRLALAFAGGLVVAGLSRLVPLAADLRPAAEPLECCRRHRARSLRDRHRRRSEGDEIGHLAERFSEMTQRLAEAEARERNFLMSVSHELRTPLTAIRGHVEALREGVVEDPELRDQSLDVIAAESERLSRLVGDILDLAKLDAHRFTLLEEEVDMESPASARTRRSARKRGDARSSTAARSLRSRSCRPTATACCRSSRTSFRTRSVGRRTAGASS